MATAKITKVVKQKKTATRVPLNFVEQPDNEDRIIEHVRQYYLECEKLDKESPEVFKDFQRVVSFTLGYVCAPAVSLLFHNFSNTDKK